MSAMAGGERSGDAMPAPRAVKPAARPPALRITALMALSRRDLLRGLAGAGPWPRVRAGASGGPTGSIVGGAHARGHRVRDGFLPAPEAWRDVAVAILGGGVSGLSAAWALERGGPSRLRRAGARRRGRRHRALRRGRGHALPLGRALRARARAGQPAARRAARRDRRHRRARRAAAIPSTPRTSSAAIRRSACSSAANGTRASTRARAPRRATSRSCSAFEADMRRWSVWRDGKGRRAFDLPRARGSDAAEVRALDRLSMAAYLDARGWRSPRLRWLVEYGCRDDFGATLGADLGLGGRALLRRPARRERARAPTS